MSFDPKGPRNEHRLEELFGYFSSESSVSALKFLSESGTDTQEIPYRARACS